MGDALSDALVSHVRLRAKQVTGNNCAFADDDVDLMAFLADRAIKAGLTDGLHPSIMESIRQREGLPE